jgi:hypothetical protein
MFQTDAHPNFAGGLMLRLMDGRDNLIVLQML